MIVMLTIYIYNYPHIKEIGQNMCSNHIYCLHALNMSLHIFPRHGAAVPPYGVYRPNGQIFYATLIRKMMINQWILGYHMGIIFPDPSIFTWRWCFGPSQFLPFEFPSSAVACRKVEGAERSQGQMMENLGCEVKMPQVLSVSQSTLDRKTNIPCFSGIQSRSRNNRYCRYCSKSTENFPLPNRTGHLIPCHVDVSLQSPSVTLLRATRYVDGIICMSSVLFRMVIEFYCSIFCMFHSHGICHPCRWVWRHRQVHHRLHWHPESSIMHIRCIHNQNQIKSNKLIWVCACIQSWKERNTVWSKCIVCKKTPTRFVTSFTTCTCQISLRTEKQQKGVVPWYEKY